MLNIFKTLISKAPFIKGGKVMPDSAKKAGGGIYFRIGMYLVGGLIIGGIIFFTGDYVAGTVLKLGDQANQASAIVQSVQSNLTGQWALDNTSATVAADLSSGGNNLSAQGGTHLVRFGETAGHSGIAGKATTFDGIDDYAYKSVSNFGSSANTGSICLWFKTATPATQQDLVSSSDEATANYYLELLIYGSKFTIMSRNAGDNVFSGTTTILQDTWYYGCAISNGSSWRLYLNGIPENLTTIGGVNNGNWFDDIPNRDNLSIGALIRTAPQYRLSGVAEDVRIYNRDLSQTQIKALYNNTGATVGSKLKLNNPASQTTVVPDGLVGYWKMDINPTTGVVTDYSSSPNNGTMTGTAKAVAVPGKMGAALSFDGVDDVVSITDAPPLQVGGTFSISTWIKVPSLAGRSPIFSTRAGASGWQLEVGGGGVDVTGTNTWIKSTENVISINNWYHIVYTRSSNDDTGTIYVNGSPANILISNAYTIANSNANKTIGVGNGFYFNGLIDEVRIYNRALTQAEVTALYTDKPLGASVGNHDTQAALPQFICGLTHGDVIPGRAPDTLMYGAVKGPDGRCWLDRNLGAPAVATSATDSANYGWLYQWGRATDGHQIVRTPDDSVTGQSSTDQVPAPNTSYFLKGSSNWRDATPPDNKSILWAGVDGGSNNPCPVGWHIPTQAEWNTFTNASGMVTAQCTPNCHLTAFNSTLKLPLVGYRDYTNAVLYWRGSRSLYWSSGLDGSLASCLYYLSSIVSIGGDDRANGFAARCIKD